jgi:large subunit ribosomal protein L21
LLIAEEDGSSVTVGSPYVAGATVSFDVVTDFQKGEKVRVVKFKRKNRYQRTIGFRPHQTVLLVTSIGGEGKKVKSSEKVEKIESEDLTVVEDEKVEKAVKKATPKAKPTK